MFLETTRNDKLKILQRRRSAEDEQMMRKHLQEGDLISAEVQNIFSDGSLSLHTRSLKYGKVIFTPYGN